MTSFLAALEAAGSNERNRDAHRSAVERLGEFMAPREPEGATPADLRGFLAYLGELGVSQQSQGVYRSVIEKWLAHLATLGPLDAPAGDGESTGVLDYSKDPDPVDHEQTWPRRHRKQPHEIAAAAAEAAQKEAAEVPFAMGTGPFGDAAIPHASAASGDFGSAFDAGAAAARQSQGVVADAWPDESPTEADMPAWVGESAAPSPFAFAAPVPPPSAEPAPKLSDFAPAPAFAVPQRTYAAPPVPSAGDFVPAPAPSEPSPFGFGAESGAFGDSTMMLPSGGAFAATAAPPAPPASAADAGATVELPAFLRAPAMPTPTAERDAFDPGFTPTVVDDSKAKKPGKSIALASVSQDMAFGAVSADEVMPAPPPSRREPKMGDDTLEGWALRTGHSERKDLSLAEIRNMALAGSITARTMVRRPGGDWMPAGQFAPLRAVFTGLADGSKALTPSRDKHPGHAEPLPPALAMILAWAGALGGAVIAAMGWWLGAVIAGQELAPLAALGGLFGGFAATWLSRSDGRASAIPGAVAGALSCVLGRYLVFETLRSGVVTFGSTAGAPDALTFIQGGLTVTFAISLGASILLGALLGFVGAGQPK